MPQWLLRQAGQYSSLDNLASLGPSWRWNSGSSEFQSSSTIIMISSGWGKSGSTSGLVSASGSYWRLSSNLSWESSPITSPPASLETSSSPDVCTTPWRGPFLLLGQPLRVSSLKIFKINDQLKKNYRKFSDWPTLHVI